MTTAPAQSTVDMIRNQWAGRIAAAQAARDRVRGVWSMPSPITVPMMPSEEAIVAEAAEVEAMVAAVQASPRARFLALAGQLEEAGANEAGYMVRGALSRDTVAYPALQPATVGAILRAVVGNGRWAVDAAVALAAESLTGKP